MSFSIPPQTCTGLVWQNTWESVCVWEGGEGGREGRREGGRGGRMCPRENEFGCF